MLARPFLLKLPPCILFDTYAKIDAHVYGAFNIIYGVGTSGRFTLHISIFFMTQLKV